ncbi:MAG: cell wall hydrolase [Alphaproteobacteria bacterium]
MTGQAALPARLWRSYPREIVAIGAFSVAGMIALAGSAWSSPNLGGISEAMDGRAAPTPPPMLVRNLAPTDAIALNNKIPVAQGANPVAKPFSVAKLDPVSRARALECLTSAVYYEAGNESDDGQRSVAQVVLNRVRHPAFPSTVCGVVYQGSTRATGCQFTFTCDGSLQRRPDVAGWNRARRIAEAALNGAVYGPVGLATHYHAYYVVPYWASTLAKSAVVGAHLFYRWAGGWGRPAAFVQRYARQEPDVSSLRSAALAALAARPVQGLAEAAKIEEIPGAEVEKAPMGRVAIRFNLAEARKATDELKLVDYVDRVKASDNLRWTLSGAADSDSDQKPLGRAPEATGAAASASKP